MPFAFLKPAGAQQDLTTVIPSSVTIGAGNTVLVGVSSHSIQSLKWIVTVKDIVTSTVGTYELFIHNETGGAVKFSRTSIGDAIDHKVHLNQTGPNNDLEFSVENTGTNPIIITAAKILVF